MNLEKVIKVTQSQYDILASGGRVGDYVGLQDDYIYMIEDENEYLPTTGGTITGNLTINGNTTFKNNSTYGSDKGIEFIHNNSSTDYVDVAIKSDYFDGEIIYNNSGWCRPLFANDSYRLIYSDNSDYLSDFTFTTKCLNIRDDGDTGNYVQIDAETYSFYYGIGGSDYNVILPLVSGTLALESYVEANPTLESGVTPTDLTSIKIGDDYYNIAGGSNIVLNNTVGSESITDTDNNITFNVVTRDTVQTISADKIIQAELSIGKSGEATPNKLHLIGRYGENQIYTGTSNQLFFSNLNQTQSAAYLDTSYFDIKTRNFRTTGNLTDGTNSITIANIQEKVQIKRYI